MRQFGYSFAAVLLAAIGVVTVAPLVAAAAPQPTAVYDAIGPTLPGNVVSLAFESTQTSEFGDLVQLAPGPRQLDSVDVVLSSWGCQDGNYQTSTCVTTPGATFSHPITLNLYESTPGVGDGVGNLVLSQTKTFDIPYRPTGNLFHCPNVLGETTGKWWNGTACMSGLATIITFDFPALPTVPTNLIWSVAYNTTSQGYNPIGAASCLSEDGACGYDALNVGAETLTPDATAGYDVDEDALLWNSVYGGRVAGNRFDTGWSGYRPLARINTVATTEAATTQVVKAIDTSWAFLAEGAAGSTGAYVTGPGAAPLGDGSAQLAVHASDQGHILVKTMLAGTRLDNLTELAYSSEQPAGTTAVALELAISYSDASPSALYQGRLVFEPTYSAGILPGGWQRWDTLTGKWWATPYGGASGGLCPQAAPCTWSQILQTWPDARINPNPTLGGVLFKAGSGLASFTGSVDQLTIGVDTAGDIAVTTYDFEPTPQCTLTCYVDGATGDNLNGGTGPSDAKKTVLAGVAQVSAGGTVIVAAGTYNEELSIAKALTLQGAGIDQSYLVGPAGGPGATIQVSAANVVVEGFTITRAGNALATWVDPTLNSAGVAIQSQGNFAEIRKNKITGNRTGIDINNSNGNHIVDNVIDYNRTGLLFRNQTDNTVMTGNFITNNWTVGVLFLDASSGSNVPVQSAANSDFSGNAIAGNWFGGVVDRQSGGSLPTAGTTNLKDFSGNWWGTNDPSVVAVDSTEAGYATSPIPAGYPGGSGTNPGGAPDIAGVASANVDYTPRLEVATDTSTNVGFQGSSAALTVTDKGAQAGSLSRLQEGVDDVIAGGTVHTTAGDYPVATPVSVNKAVSLMGPNAGIAPNDATTPLTANAARGAEATLSPTGANVVLQIGSADVTIDGFRFTDPGTAGASNSTLIGAGGNFGGEADDISIVNNLFDAITRVAVYFNGPTIMDGATVDNNRVANPTRAAGCGTPAATATSSCGRQLFNFWQTDHVSFQDNVVFAPAGNGDRMRVLQVSFPNAPSEQADSPAANSIIDGNTIRNACVYTCFGVAIGATNVEITNNDVQIDAGNIVQLRKEWNSGRVLIDHNLFADPNDFAITLDVTSPVVASDLSQVTISRNSITGGGIRNERTESATAQCNWWGQANGALTAQNTGPSDVTNALATSNLDGPCNAPTDVTGLAGDARVTVSWTAPTPDGTTVTGYVVTAAPGGATCTTTGATTCVVTGLTNGTAYTFTVVGTTATAGNTPPSAASAPVTPVATVIPPLGIPDFNPVNPDRVVDTRVGAPN
ncbi:MAG TPA: right-handed parallel beta-helix repeat-containing protein, partial [Ilumatobacteraceae bacterium]|nr:right-handed parallel beta-helix repeat-containing protein [Ilumatobacteraceae bacterium]HRB03310.1 right-handed parallel beta-helix repeat-containing protein [Ilumatobacteraceae bacterium]